MKWPRLFCGVATALGASGASAAAIVPGEPLDLIVPGTASLYEIFEHKGDPGGELPGQTSSPAVQLDFTPGLKNRFAFSVAGLAGCCAPEPASYPPDGGRRLRGGVGGANGLSDAAGDTALGLLGAFTTTADPAVRPAPPTRSWDADSPGSFAPLLHQTFYIGDGRSGYDDTVGSTLLFTAPPDASRLYLGLADALSFGGPPGFYGDNPGSYSVRTLLAQQEVAEPAAHALTGLIIAALVAALRARRRDG